MSSLFDGGGAERIGCTEHHLVTGGLVLVCQFADGGCLADSVDADNHDHIRLAGLLDLEILEFALILGFLEHIGNFLGEKAAEFLAAHILVAGDAFLQSVDYFKGSVGADITGDESLLEIVEHIIVDLAFSAMA